MKLVSKHVRRVNALRLEQLVACSDLDQRGEVAPRPYRQPQLRHRYVEQTIAVLVETEPFVLDVRVPLVKLDDEIDDLGLTHARDPKQVLDVDDSQAADLHAVAEDSGGAT